MPRSYFRTCTPQKFYALRCSVLDPQCLRGVAGRSGGHLHSRPVARGRIRACRLAGLCPDKAELKAGGVDAVIAAFTPHRHRDEVVAKCIAYFTANKAQMQYDKYRRQGMQIGSGVIESAGRQIVGLRMKRPGSHWSVTAANAVLAIKCCLTNHMWVDFLHWKAQQAVAA